MGPQFLLTREEKAIRERAGGGSGRGSGRKHGAKFHQSRRVPVCGYLRPKNIIGGSFSRTAAGRIPEYVLEYVNQQISTVAPAGGG